MGNFSDIGNFLTSTLSNINPVGNLFRAFGTGDPAAIFPSLAATVASVAGLPEVGAAEGAIGAGATEAGAESLGPGFGVGEAAGQSAGSFISSLVGAGGPGTGISDIAASIGASPADFGGFISEPGGAGSFGDFVGRATTALGAEGAGGALSLPGGGVDLSGAVPAGGAVSPVLSTGVPDLVGGLGSPSTDLASFLKTSAAIPPAGGGDTGVVGTILDFARKNPALLLGGAGLGANLLARPALPKQIRQAGQVVSGQEAPLARTTASEGTSLISSLRTGQLPPGMEALVQNYVDSARAQIISSANARGMSTSDTPIQQELANVDKQAAELRAKIAATVSDFGLKELEASGAITSDEASQLASLGQVQLQMDQGLQQAIAEFAAALGLGAGFEAARA